MIVTPRWFGTHIQGEWIADDGSLYQPVTKYFGLHRMWDGRAVWHKMESDPNALEANIRFALSRGAEPMFTFGEPPDSAVLSGYTKVPTMEAWERFVRSVVTEAAGRIHFYDGWNEPAMPPYWDGTQELLVTYERRKYEIIKELQPDSVVLSPSITEPGLARGIDFFDRYLGAGGADWCDEISYHGYAERPEHLIGYDWSLRGLLGRHGVTKKIRNTEYAVGPCDLGVRSALQAQSYIIQAALGYVGVVWNPHLEWAQDYTDDTTQRVADVILGATVGPLMQDGEVRYVTVSRPGQVIQELSWTEYSFPALSAVRHFPPVTKGKRGCLLALLPL